MSSIFQQYAASIGYENPVKDAGVPFPDPDASSGLGNLGPSGQPGPMGAPPPGQPASPSGDELKMMLKQVLLEKAKARSEASTEFQEKAMKLSKTSKLGSNGGPVGGSVSGGY